MLKLVHVNKIEKVRIADLSSLRIVSPSTCRFVKDVHFSEISIKELAGVSVEDSYENNQKIFTTTITFHAMDHEPLSDRQYAFRLTTVKGEKFLVGTNTRPYPIIKENTPYPEKPADNMLKKMTITWKSIYPMLKIL